jgi:hypothetical protein
MRYRIICTIALFGVGFLMAAQVQQEGLVLLTDRGHYISGESIKYRAFYRKPAGNEKEWSRVLYVELILPNGEPLSQSKVIIGPDGSRGRLTIPGDISSGTYYLKAYTRWMRNCGPEGYAYTSVNIYDPFRETVLPADSAGWSPAPPEQLLNQGETYSPEMLECRLGQTGFGTRQEVEADIKWKAEEAPLSLSVSVARAGLHGNQEYFRPGCPVDRRINSSILPEVQGLSLTGRVISSSGGKTVPYATVYVSMLGDERNFFCNYSDSSGMFYFAFPDYEGKRELFVSAYHAEINDLELQIDRDFSQDALELPSDPVKLDDSLSAIITGMSVNAQISQQYYPESEPVPGTSKSSSMMFYGAPTSTIRFDDFIKLPTLEEYFTEVIPQVAVRRNRGVRRLVLLGEHPDLAIYPPLLMIDGVAIFDIDAVLAVSPRLIDRVEIVNAPYIRGNVTFGGIISLISKNNDLGYIDLPSSGLLVNYRMLDQSVPDTIQNGVADPRLPDVRNTLYWNPGLDLVTGQEERITFRTSDTKGDYEILFRGTDPRGKYLEKRVTFRVE